MKPLSRRALLEAAAAIGAGACAPRLSIATMTQATSDLAADFDDAWTFCRDTYCFFPGKTTDWDRVRATHAPLAHGARDAPALADVIDSAFGELYDPHCHVQGEREHARRWVPFDLWAEWRDGGDALVTAVRSDSMASDAGVRPGDTIVALDGVAIADAAHALRPRCLLRPDADADSWALLSALAGRRMAPRRLTLRTPDGKTRDAALVPDPDSKGGGDPPPVTFERDGRLGYVRIASFGDETIVGLFDQALEALRDTDGLVLDVRENGGGDTAYARPMMGRFTKTRAQYAWMARRAKDGAGLGQRWPEYVEPRGPFTYDCPVVVLVDRFSASMAEGFPMGMRAIAGARIVGTRMAGLGAAIQSTTLPRSGLTVQVSAEPVFDVGGRPRWELVPDVTVKPWDPPPAPGEDCIRIAGVSALLTAPASR